jgi:hypothetical protein
MKSTSDSQEHSDCKAAKNVHGNFVFRYGLNLSSLVPYARETWSVIAGDRGKRERLRMFEKEILKIRERKQQDGRENYITMEGVSPCKYQGAGGRIISK